MSHTLSALELSISRQPPFKLRNYFFSDKHYIMIIPKEGGFVKNLQEIGD